MLIRFQVSNFLSFYERQSLDMFPSAIQKHPHHKYITKTTLTDILKSAVIYGPNSSGKSNFFKAISFAKNFITKGSKNKNFIDVPTFKLNDEKKASEFIFEVYVNGKTFQYGFEIYESIVIKEWMKRVYKKGNDQNIFLREKKNGKLKIQYYKNVAGKKKLVIDSIKAEIKDNQLFLTVINSKNKKNIPLELAELFDWFENTLTVIFPDSIAKGIPWGILKNENYDQLYQKYLNILDTGIEKLSFEEYSLDDEIITLPKEMKTDIKNSLDENDKFILISSMDGFERFLIKREKNNFIAYKLKATHKKTDNSEIKFDFDEESDGTNRIINIIPALIMLTKTEKVILIDEMDRSLHSLIPTKIFDIFFDITKNRASQFIITTHDINLLDLKKFRRDEIWFMKKNYKYESELYSLEEFKTRFDKELRKAYLNGIYGAIPIFTD